MDSHLNIGIVGLGAHAQRSHINPLGELARARVVAACDPSESARARQRANGFSGPCYETLPELLADPNVEALIVCSPDRFHAQALAAGVAAGKHMLVEKPVAERRADLPLITGALADAGRQGLVVSSCHPRRLDPPFMWFKEHLPDLRAQLGVVLDLRFDFFYHRPSKAGLHHGLLIDHVNHEIDLIHFLLGYCPFTAYKLFDSELRYGVAGSRTDGLCFTFFGSRHLERKAYSELMRVRFERGEAEVDAETGDATVRDWETNTTTVLRCGATDYERRFLAVNADFLDAILDGNDCYLSTTDLIINTETGIALTETGRYDSSTSAAIQLPSA